MNTPRVSICIPTYNGEKFLAETLRSASAQVGEDVEILVIDDGSTDSSYEIAERHAEIDTRVRLLRSKHNRGLVGNWNRCIVEARGEWIKFLFQDDVLSPAYLPRVGPYLDGTCPFIVTRREFRIEPGTPDSFSRIYDGCRSLSDVAVRERVLTPEDFAWIMVNFLNVNVIGEPSNTMFRRSVVQEVGFFLPEMKQIVDLEFWARLGCRFGVVNIPEVLSTFRVHSSSTSSKNYHTEHFKSSVIDTLILLHDYCFSPHYRTFRRASQQAGIAVDWFLASYLLEVEKEITKLEAAGIGMEAAEADIYRPLGNCCLIRPILWRTLRAKLPARAALLSGHFSELIY